MLNTELRDYRCPRSGSTLTLADPVFKGDEIVSGELVSAEGLRYPIEDGIPNLLDVEHLTERESSTLAEYDRVADDIYDVALDWQFAALYEDEEKARETMLDMLELAPGDRVLEVGAGTGRDSFRLARRLTAAGHLHMQDLSPKMVHACARKMAEVSRSERLACGLSYSASNAAHLPFPDDSFDAVFHFGGFNQFGDLRQGAAELTRVAKPGSRIVIGDEAVAPWLRDTEFAAIVTTNNPLFKADVPLDVLPIGARDVVVRWIIGNCFYVIGFSKGEGPPPINLDLPHQGWRGGTMRTRYFGTLEGVSVDAKAMAQSAARKSGLSLHEWLDRVIKSEASEVLARK